MAQFVLCTRESCLHPFTSSTVRTKETLRERRAFSFTSSLSKRRFRVVEDLFTTCAVLIHAGHRRLCADLQRHHCRALRTARALLKT